MPCLLLRNISTIPSSMRTIRLYGNEFFVIYSSRRTSIILVLILMVAALPSEVKKSQKSGPCEKIEDLIWYEEIDPRKTCYMWSSTWIDSDDFLIKSEVDRSVGGFRASDNKKVKYLPKNLGETFPNLTVLDAGWCSIKVITKENFKGLAQLQVLALAYNKIEKIDDDTFDHIPAISIIALREYFIKIFLCGSCIKF